MSSCHTILNYALGNRFQKVSNPLGLGVDMHATLSRLTYAANRAFDSAGNPYALDLEEIVARSPACTNPASFAFFMTLHSGTPLDIAAQKKLAIDLIEPSVRLQYNTNGTVDLITTKTAITDDQDTRAHKTARSLTVKSTDQMAVQSFVGAWLRANLSAHTMVDIANELERIDEKEARRWADTVVGRLEKVKKRAHV